MGGRVFSPHLGPLKASLPRLRKHPTDHPFKIYASASMVFFTQRKNRNAGEHASEPLI
jgi:hypothetical protein